MYKKYIPVILALSLSNNIIAQININSSQSINIVNLDIDEDSYKIDYDYIKDGMKYIGVKINGKTVIPPIYEHISNNNGTFIAFSKDDKITIYDKDGKEIIKLIDTKQHIYSQSNKYVTYSIIEINNKYHIFYEEKDLGSYENITMFKNGFISSKNNKYGWITKEKNTIPFKYNNIYFDKKKCENSKEFMKEVYKVDDLCLDRTKIKNLIVINKKKKYGILNINGENVIPFNYDRIKIENDKNDKFILTQF